jgi:hypothetical protein
LNGNNNSSDANTSKALAESKPSPQPPNIGAEIDLFVNQIDALAETLPLSIESIHQVWHGANAEVKSFLSKECKTEQKEDGKTYYTFDGNQYLKYSRLNRRAGKASIARTLVPRGLFVALVSQFDAYVGALVKNLFRLKPQIVDSSGKSMTFAELSKFASLDEARDYMIEKEIDGLLRESHADQFDWLEKKFSIQLCKDLASWPAFIELTERRNLFVHTNGIVSRQYLEICGRHSCQIAEDVRIGSTLPLKREYFDAAYRCLYEIGVKLGQVLWRRLAPDQLAKADSNLVLISYALINEGRYQLARELLDFATSLPRHSAEDQRLRLVVNRAQTYKWMTDEAKCKEILEEEDWTAKNLKFQLAHAVLTSDFSRAISVVKQIGATEPELDKHSYREWPLFREFRKCPDFIAVFEQIFREPLNNILVPDSQTNEPKTELPN